MTPSDAALLDLTRATARTAAEYVRANRPAGRVLVADTKSSDTDVVTEVDRATEELIRTMIGAARPDDALVGEESGESTGTSTVTWIVDPIDGTVNFVHGIPAYAVSIAASVDGVVRTGSVVNVMSGEEYSASRGGGAVAVASDGTETPLGPPVRTDLARALVGTGFSYTASVRARQGSAVATMLGSVADVRRIGSAALDLCNVACGRLDAYVEEGLLAWDLAAGRLIAEEAGVIVAGLDGPPDERLTVASVPSIADDFMALVRRSGF